MVHAAYMRTVFGGDFFEKEEDTFDETQGRTYLDFLREDPTLRPNPYYLVTRCQAFPDIYGQPVLIFGGASLTGAQYRNIALLNMKLKGSTPAEDDDWRGDIEALSKEAKRLNKAQAEQAAKEEAARAALALKEKEEEEKALQALLQAGGGGGGQDGASSPPGGNAILRAAPRPGSRPASAPQGVELSHDNPLSNGRKGGRQGGAPK